MGVKTSRRRWIFILVGVLLLVGAAICILGGLLFTRPTGYSASSEEPTPTQPASQPTATLRREEAPEPPEPEYEPTRTIVEAAHDSDATTLGQIDVEYPTSMNPGSSDTVIVAVYVPPQLASLAPTVIERIEPPDDLRRSSASGDIASHQATILIAERMRLELSSPSFEIESLYPATQEVDIRQSNQPTNWAWTIKAPGAAGKHVFTVNAFLGDAAAPSWTGSFAVEVVAAGSGPVEPEEGAGLSAALIPALVLLGTTFLITAGLAVTYMAVIRPRRKSERVPAAPREPGYRDLDEELEEGEKTTLISPGGRPLSERRALSYLDFDLEIEAVGEGEYRVEVVSSPAGEAEGTTRLPFDELTLENRLLTLQNALLRSGSQTRQALAPDERAVRDFGCALFDALLVGGVRTCYDISQYEAEERDHGLRLKLRIQPPELAVLPWEFLYDPRQAEYVCLSRNTPVVRFLELQRRVPSLAVKPPLRVLGMIASPNDLLPLDVRHERQRVERALVGLKARKLVDLQWLAGATWRDLQRAMRGGPWHIFHFIGHGGFDRAADEGFIALADEEGATHRLEATQLGRLLADHRSLRLALLNSCEGARGGKDDIFSSSATILVRRGIPAVLSMQYPISDQAAIEFARAFYESLADGMAVDAAVAEARKAVSVATDSLEWGTPVLYMRSPDGVLFEMG